MHPRQYDNLTVHFFPRTSFGTNVLEEILIHLSGLGILPTRLSCRTPYSKLSRCVARTNLQQFIARFLVLASIIQRLKSLLYKDLVLRISLFCILTPCLVLDPLPEGRGNSRSVL